MFATVSVTDFSHRHVLGMTCASREAPDGRVLVLLSAPRHADRVGDDERGARYHVVLGYRMNDTP